MNKGRMEGRLVRGSSALKTTPLIHLSAPKCSRGSSELKNKIKPEPALNLLCLLALKFTVQQQYSTTRELTTENIKLMCLCINEVKCL